MSSALLSPRNGKPMQARKFGNIELDVDPETGGTWLDGTELEALTEWFHDGDEFEKLAVRHAGSVTHDTVSGACPRCRTATLKEYPLPCFDGSNVTLDICSACKGLWIDGPELGPVRTTMMKNRGANFTATVTVDSNRPLWLRMIYPGWLKNLVDSRSRRQ
jgi:Zn-finger nucleic acid-binding protein